MLFRAIDLIWLSVVALLIGTVDRALSQTALPAVPATAVVQPSPSPSPQVMLTGALLGSGAFTGGVNAIGNLANGGASDQAGRFNLSSAVLSVTRSTGVFRYAVTTGAYSFPVVGASGNGTFQSGANTNLFGPAPVASVSFNPTEHLAVSAGYLGTLTGSENAFTFQNPIVQRGLGWNMENIINRGVRLTTSSGKYTANLGINDGFFSGHYLGFEGGLTIAPDSNSSIGLVALIPNASAPSNWTAAIANKQLYNVTYSVTSGKWNFQPYLLWTQSPKSSALGYTKSEAAWAAVFGTTYTLNPNWSLAARVEGVGNTSATTDPSLNADLIGYGPGSGAWTFTLTPAFRWKQFLLRTDLSEVSVRSGTPGVLFGKAGTQSSQFRVVVESGITF